MVKRLSATMEKEEQQPFIDECLPKLKLEFSYLWMNYQARKRKYFKKNQTKMPVEMMKKAKKEIEEQPLEEKVKWARNLLRKLKKDIKPESRDEFIKAVKGITQTDCVMTNPDQKGKMRRIDCLRQADKVWRLDLVIMVLFHAAPLESTDGERLARMLVCKQKTLCVNPHHIGLVAKGLDIYLSNYLYKKDLEGSPNIILTGILIKDKTVSPIREKSPTYPALEVFHKELPPVKIRINDRCHPYLQHSISNEPLDLNNNDKNNDDPPVSPSPALCKTEALTTFSEYPPDQFNQNIRGAQMQYSPHTSGCAVIKDQMSYEDHLNQNMKMYKNPLYTGICNRTNTRPSQKHRSFSSPSPQTRHYSFSNEIDIDLEQSMIYSYPQNGCSTSRQVVNRNYQPQVPSFEQTPQHYQHQQMTNFTPTIYVQPVDYNSSCGSEISSASMASYSSENNFSSHNYQQPSVEFYYDTESTRFNLMPLHNISSAEVTSKTNCYSSLNGYPSS